MNTSTVPVSRPEINNNDIIIIILCLRCGYGSNAGTDTMTLTENVASFLWWGVC